MRERGADAADEWVGGQSTERVGAAALQSHHEVRQRSRYARVSFEEIGEFLERSHPLGHLVVDRLCVETADATRVELRDIEQCRQLIVLTAQSDDQHATRVGVGGERCQHAASVREVIT